MNGLNAIDRGLSRRRLVSVGFRLFLALAIAVPLLPAPRAAHATTPPGPCEAWEEGQGGLAGGQVYVCNCWAVPGDPPVKCEWVLFEEAALEANANLKYATAQLDYGGDYAGMLRAGADAIGPWEHFMLSGSGAGDGTWVVRSVENRKLVSAEFAYPGDDNGMLRARANLIGDYEKFYLYQIGPQYALQSYLPPGSTCCYVSTELGFGGIRSAMLRARATVVGAWEKYWKIHLGGSFLLSSTPPAGGAKAPLGATTVACPAALTSMLDVPCERLIPPDTDPMKVVFLK